MERSGGVSTKPSMPFTKKTTWRFLAESAVIDADDAATWISAPGQADRTSGSVDTGLDSYQRRYVGRLETAHFGAR
jgi:hypothetical protein